MRTRELYEKHRDRILGKRRDKYVPHPSRELGRAVKLEVIAYLKAVPCLDCGQSFPPECMDFDHVRDGKSFSIAHFNNRSLDALLEEIDKCDIVCANCHRIRTKARRQY
jgi:hypothetical protein